MLQLIIVLPNLLHGEKVKAVAFLILTIAIMISFAMIKTSHVTQMQLELEDVVLIHLQDLACYKNTLQTQYVLIRAIN